MNQETSNIVTVAISGITLLLAIMSLWYLKKYTEETIQLRKSAQDQVEAPNKPCLTLATKPRAAREAIVDRHNFEIDSVDPPSFWKISAPASL